MSTADGESEPWFKRGNHSNGMLAVWLFVALGVGGLTGSLVEARSASKRESRVIEYLEGDSKGPLEVRTLEREGFEVVSQSERIITKEGLNLRGTYLGDETVKVINITLER